MFSSLRIRTIRVRWFGLGEGIAFTYHHEMCGIGFFDLRLTAAGEAEAVAFVLIDGEGWLEVQVMGMEAEQSQNAAGLGKIAADHAFQNGNLPALPAFEIRRGKQVHFHEKPGRCDETLAREDTGNRSHDFRVFLELAIVGNGGFGGVGHDLSARNRLVGAYSACP